MMPVSGNLENTIAMKIPYIASVLSNWEAHAAQTLSLTSSENVNARTQKWTNDIQPII